MPDTHRPHEGSQRQPGARSALAAVMLQKQLLQRSPHLWSRFLAIYAQLQRLPRRWRRLVRKAAVSLAGVALLLALGRAPSNNVVHAATITVDAGHVTITKDNYCSLREAIINANKGNKTYGECGTGTSGADTIILPDNVTFTLNDAHANYYYSDTGLPLITSEITIEGNGAIIQRETTDSDEFCLLAVGSGGKLTLKDTTLSGGRTNYGGAIYSYGGDVTISNSAFNNNQARYGGAIFADNGDVTIHTSTFTGNDATYSGGAIFNGAALTVYDSTFYNNKAERDGGAIYNLNELTIYYSIFSGNRAYERGGAIYILSNQVTIHNSDFSGNNAPFDGGAIFNQVGYLVTYNSTFSGNYTDDGGGAIYNNDDLTIHSSTFSGNTADDGGAIYNNDNLTIHNSTFSENVADEEGGAIYNQDYLSIHNSAFSGNYAVEDGGAIYNDSELTIYNSTFSGNTAGNGGAIYNFHELTIHNSTLSGNTAEQGGAIHTIGYLTVTNSTFSDNKAGEGGAISNDHDMIINNSTFSLNTAVGGGGAIYNRGQLTIGRSLVSGNSADGDGDEIYNNESGTIKNSYNLFGHDGITINDALYGFTPDPTDIIATNGSPNHTQLDAILAEELGENGGPQVGAPGSAQQIQTFALKQNSPAIDAAPSAACEDEPVNGLDQRGFFRNVDGRDDGDPEGKECDIGAFEYKSFPPLAVFMTAAGPGMTENGVAFGKEDILGIRELESGEWELFFDGSAAGLTNKHDINAIYVNTASADSTDLYLSFFQNKIKTANLGTVFGHDIIHYDGSNFSLFFDGSDVGLTTTAEKIDALHIFDGPVDFPGGEKCNTYLLLSTVGTGKVPLFGGGNLKFQGEDILGFCLTNSGASTAGFWHMVLDGSAVGLPKNSTDSLSASKNDQIIYLTTQGTFNVGSFSGDHSMVYAFNRNTGRFSGPHFSAPESGLHKKVDGLHVASNLP